MLIADNPKRWKWRFFLSTQSSTTADNLNHTGETDENVFLNLRNVVGALEELDVAKETRNDCAVKVEEKQELLDEVAAQHEQVKRKIALLIDEGEQYVVKAKEIAAGSGRVAMTVAEAATKPYVEDMISTDTLQMDSD